MANPLLEICVDALDSAIYAAEGGADRLEICANLMEGGTTPSLGLVKACVEQTKLPIRVMIRPRGGDFLYSQTEFALMLQEIALLKPLGIEGVVVGMLTPDGQIDRLRLQQLVEYAHPLAVTFHRAFDLTRDPLEALAVLSQTGVDTLLTSGQAPTALKGADLIRKVVDTAPQSLSIMPGGGIIPENLPLIQQATGATAFHGTARSWQAGGMIFKREKVPMGTEGTENYRRRVTDAIKVRAMRTYLDRLT